MHRGIVHSGAAGGGFLRLFALGGEAKGSHHEWRNHEKACDYECEGLEKGFHRL